MAWYDEAIFYHIYPLGLLGVSKQNSYTEQAHRFDALSEWMQAVHDLGFNALYIGPLFESVGHGYETTDYRKVDGRIGTNEELKAFVAECHALGIRVVLDAVFNHTGRDFFAFRALREKREQSPYRDWYRGVNFGGNNSYHDGFSYETWGGYDLLPKLNLQNPAVRQYHLDSVRFWVHEFDIDGLRLDAADVLDFTFLRELRSLTDALKPDFWLMGEVIHGEYNRWTGSGMLHSVTDYPLHKALFSAHNDRNYFEIAHTLKRHMDGGVDPRRLYHFVDNHDVDRIVSKLNNPYAWLPVHVLLFTLPGIPSVYYGSEYGIPGKKERGSDDPIRPALNLSEMIRRDPYYADTIMTLAALRRSEPALVYGDFRQLVLTTTHYAFARGDVLIAVNNDASGITLSLPCPNGAYRGMLHGTNYQSENGQLSLSLDAVDAEVLVPQSRSTESYQPIRMPKIEQHPAPAASSVLPPVPDKPYEQMTVSELQAAILEKLGKNGPITDRMRREVQENVYPNSLLNWVKSFR